MADFNLNEVLIKARDEAVAATGKEAAAATSRAIKRIANPEKKSLPAPTLKAKAAPDWFKYGLYALAAIVGIKVVQSVAE